MYPPWLVAKILDVRAHFNHHFMEGMGLTRISSGQIQGWQGMVAVDGAAYSWLGGAPGHKLVNQVSLEYTSTRSIFTFDVDSKVKLTVTFLSPVYADDLERQSQQFSYVSVKVTSADHAVHEVQVYMDVSGGTDSKPHEPCVLTLMRLTVSTKQNGPAGMSPRLSTGTLAHPTTSHTTGSSVLSNKNSPSLGRLPAGEIGIWRLARATV